MLTHWQLLPVPYALARRPFDKGDSSVKQLAAQSTGLPSTLEAWKQVAAKREQTPFHTCSTIMSSWRNVFDKIDFGQGGPTVTVGTLPPHRMEFSVVTEGPGGDGVMCAMTFPEDDFERLQASRILQDVSAEASFVKGATAQPSRETGLALLKQPCKQ